MQSNNDTKVILTALHKVMSEVGYVQKKSKNEFHKYTYASEGDLLKVLRPAMNEAGLMLIPSGENVSHVDKDGNTNITVLYTLCHKDGAVWPEPIRAFGCGNDKNSKGGVGDKGLYKAITGANKYLLFKLFQIETGNDPEQDDNNNSGESPPQKQPEQSASSEDSNLSSDKQYMQEYLMKQAGGREKIFHAKLKHVLNANGFGKEATVCTAVSQLSDDVVSVIIENVKRNLK